MSLKELDPRLYHDLQNRMKRIEGQVRGVQRLLEEGSDCDTVVVQLAAIRAALQRVGVKLVSCQLSSLMAEEIQKGGTGKASTEEMAETFLRLS